MKRSKFFELVNWKDKPQRKPLLIRGARQVGKTWLMKEFGRLCFEKTAYINFEKNRRLQTLFSDDFSTDRIIIALQAESGVTISPDNTLIIFDEIQSAPGAIGSLKYFYEDAPQYHVIAAGSLLGVALHSKESFPVGKVDVLDLHPLTFFEFLDAMGQDAMVEVLKSKDWKLIEAFKTKCIEYLRQYYFVGGMPEAVSVFTQNYDYSDARRVQRAILDAYDLDFSKHAPIELVPRIRMVWNSIPSQLAKENRKFIYGVVREGARAKDFELAIQWLVNCSQVHKVFRISKPAIPLKFYEDRNAFKMYLVDIGLLSAMVELDVKTLLEGNSLFSEFKGALTEQFVLQQLKADNDFSIYYWSAERSTAKVDFVIQNEGEVIPIEVKAEENLQAKSLKVFVDKYKPRRAVRISMSDYREQEWLVNIPLYSVSELLGAIK